MCRDAGQGQSAGLKASAFPTGLSSAGPRGRARPTPQNCLNPSVASMHLLGRAVLVYAQGAELGGGLGASWV